MAEFTENQAGQAEADGVLPEHAHPIRLPVFEGPLDLLLYLIRKNEIDIHDIPIGVVTKQYLEVLRAYEHPDLDVAGEFFVMAATLMVIKSRMLLPPEKLPAEAAGVADEIDREEALDPRWQLVRQLIQYKRIKESAGYLHALIETRQGFATRLVPPPVEKESDRPVSESDRIELWTTFNNILRRLAERVLPGEIRAETVTITTRMEDILARLRHEPRFTFTSLIPAHATIPMLVATFLACLELAKMGKLLISQSANFDDILCEERPADDILVLDFSPAPEGAADGAPDEEVAEAQSSEAWSEFGESAADEEDDDEDEYDDDDDDDDEEDEQEGGAGACESADEEASETAAPADDEPSEPTSGGARA